MRYVDIVFDGPPGPKNPSFVEVEDEHGKSIIIGTTMRRMATGCCAS
jgi:hypothetical protein